MQRQSLRCFSSSPAASARLLAQSRLLASAVVALALAASAATPLTAYALGNGLLPGSMQVHPEYHPLPLSFQQRVTFHT